MRNSIIAAALALSLAPVTAAAQTAPDQDADRAADRLDRTIDRALSDWRAGRDPASFLERKKPTWTIEFSTPLAFNSNIGNESTGAKSSSYVDPTFKLTGRWEVDGMAITAEAGTDTQVFSSNSNYDNATVYGRFAVAKQDNKVSGQFLPYAEYRVLSIYDGIYDQHSITLHQLSAGVRTTFNLGGSETDKLKLNLAAARREASVAAAEQWRYTASATYLNGSGLSISAQFRFADFSGGTNAGRIDKNLQLGIGYDVELDPELTLTLGTTFERNWSNRANRDYTTWDLGPAISLTRSF